MTVIPDKDVRPGYAAALIIVLILGLAAIRATGLSDLMDNEQQRQIAYVMDVVQNHHWMIQVDQGGQITSKPPLFTWLGAISTLIFGAPEPYAVRMIALLATAGTVLLVYWMSRWFFTGRAALLAGIVYLVCAPIGQQIWMARMDALLPFTIACGVFAAWLAWQGKCSWIWFWLAAAAGVLTKGPIGLVCAAPLAAVFFNRRSGIPRARQRGHLLGIALFIFITLGWFLGACAIMGQDVYHKLIIEEFLNQAVRVNKSRFIGSRFYEPLGAFFMLFFPWSLVAVAALWRMFKFSRFNRVVSVRGFEVVTEHQEIKQVGSSPKGTTSDGSLQYLLQRRFELFIACWLLVGIIPFCLGTHQRGALIAPLYAPVAILAGRELARWLDRLGQRVFFAIACAITVIGLGVFYIQYHLRPTSAMRSTQAVAELVGQIRQHVDAAFPLTHVDDPTAVIIDLNTMRPYYFGTTKSTTGDYDAALNQTYDLDAAIKLLSRPEAVFLVVFDSPDFRKRLPAAAPPVHVLANVTLPDSGKLCVISNKPELRYYDDMVMGIGPLMLQSHKLHWVSASANDFSVAGSGSLTLTNNISSPQTVRVIHNGKVETHIVEPGEVWGVVYP